MVIDRIRIENFGALREKEIVFSRGVNIIEGENESGKTTVAAFIRFMFYGFPEKKDAERYLAFSGNTAAGTLDCTVNDRGAEDVPYRITRTYRGEDGGEDSVLVNRLDTGEQVFSGEVPGEVFFGVDAALFTSTVFVRQIGGDGAGADSGPSGGAVVRPSVLHDAVSNILNTGRETTDLNSALARLRERLDALYDPTAKRGTIYDMEKQRTALAVRLESAEKEQAERKNAAEGITADAEELRRGISDCERRISDHDKRSEKLRLCLQRYEEYRQFGNTDRLNELLTRRTSALRRTRELCDTMFRGSYIPDGEYVDALLQCADTMHTANEERKEAEVALRKLNFNASRDNIKEDLLRRVEMDGGVDEIGAFLRGRRLRRNVVTACGVAFLIPAVLAAVITGVVFYLGADITRLCLIISALLFTLAAFFFLCRVRYNRDFQNVYERYGCETGDELENFLEEYGILQNRFHHDTEERETLRLKIAECGQVFDGAAKTAAGLLSRLQPDGFPDILPERVSETTLRTAADRIAETLNELSLLLEGADSCNDELLSLVRENGIEAKDADEAASLWQKRYRELYTFFDGKPLSEIDTDIVLRELDFNQKTNRALEQKIADMRKTLQALESADTAPSPDTDPGTLSGLLAEFDRRLLGERRTYAALELAAEMLKKAAERLRASLAPSLTAHASELLCRLTGRGCCDLALNEQDRLVCRQAGGGTSFPVEYLSAGTQDVAYLSLRLALLHRLYEKNLPPLLFDEAFVSLDDRRLTRMLALLFEDAGGEAPENGVQTLIFTCHRREREAAEAVKSCHVVVLDLPVSQAGE